MAACSPYMEATRPTPLDTNDYPTGMTRDQVFQKLGGPYNTSTESDGATCDFYKLYTRGYGAAGKVPIAVVETAADVFTGGLAEIILYPTESATKNEKHPVAFCYKNQQLVRVTYEGMPTADALPTVAPGQNPPITAAESDTSRSLKVAAIPTFAPTPSVSAQPSAAPSPNKK